MMLLNYLNENGTIEIFKSFFIIFARIGTTETMMPVKSFESLWLTTAIDEKMA